MVKWNHRRMRVITSNLPQKYLDEIEKFMEWGITPSRSEYIRRAINTQINIDHELIKDTDNVIAGKYDHIKFDPSKFVRVPVENPVSLHLKEFKTYKIVRRLE